MWRESEKAMTKKGETICPVLFKIALEMELSTVAEKYGGFLCPLEKKKHTCGKCDKEHDNWIDAQHFRTEKI